jgi:hypothetical protein
MGSVFRATYIHIGAALQSCDWLRGAAGAGTWQQRGGAASKSPPPSLRYFPVPPQFKEKTGGIEHDMFETFENRPGAVTRAAGGQANFKQQAARGEIRKNAFAVRTVSVWNGLPEIIKTSRTCDQFKRNLKQWRANGVRPISYRSVAPGRARDGRPREGRDGSTMPLPWGRLSLVTKVNKVNKEYRK